MSLLFFFQITEGDWFVAAQYNTINVYNGTQCLRYQYHKTDKPNILTITKHQRYFNQTRFQGQEQITIEESNYVKYKSANPEINGGYRI